MENITVLGIGKLGLGLALLIEKAGYNVLGVDISEDYIKSLNSKTLKTEEPGYENLLKESKNFRATLDFAEGLNHSDTIFDVWSAKSTGIRLIGSGPHLVTTCARSRFFGMATSRSINSCRFPDYFLHSHR